MTDKASMGIESTFNIQQHVEKALDAWKARLVSFDGNNKQIFYKPLKVGTVDFDDKFGDLQAIQNLLDGKKVKTSQIYPRLITKIESKEVQDLARVDSTVDEEVDDANVDLNAEKDLNKAWALRLRRFEAIFRKTRIDSEEKNIETCFLAEAFCTWDMKTTGGSIPNAPFIFHPMKIDSVSRGNNDFTLEKGSDGVLNDALILYFQTEHGLPQEIFQVASSEIYPGSQSMQTLVNRISDSVPGFKINSKRILGNFSFAQYPMVMDLERIKKQGTSHTVISALAKVGKAKEELERMGSEESIAELSIKNPILEHLVFPADSSQHEAISAIVGGKNIVIQGPPGTGKSQTIANVIAECVATKKSVLFVAEKRAAIDAVAERLNDVGLGGIVLNLHDEPDKKTIAQTLTQILKQYSVMKEPRPAEVSKLYEVKKNLQRRWEWLDSPTLLADSQGNFYSVYNLFREVGERGARLNSEQLLESKVFVPNIEDIPSQVRDEISGLIAVLYRCDFFGTRKDHKATAHLIELLKTQEVANRLNELVANLYHLMQTREFVKSIDLARSLIPETDQNPKAILKTFTLYSETKSIISKWNFDRYQEILALKPLLTGFSDYRHAHGLGVVPAFFSRRKEIKKLLEFRTDSDAPTKPLSFLRDIEELENSVETWATFGGSIEVLKLSQGLGTTNRLIHDIVSNLLSLSSIISESNWDVLPFDTLILKCKALFLDSEYIRDLPQLSFAKEFLLKYRLSGVLEFLDVEKISQGSASQYWEYLWFSSHLQRTLVNTSKSSFNSSALNQDIVEFVARDKVEFSANPSRIIRGITTSLFQLRSPGFDLLTKQSSLKSGHMPFRELLTKATAEILSIKPCFAMSPRAVSRMLPCKEGLFDVVIFDEASQIKPENAITSIYRGKQVVVAGDRHQLPPTKVGFSDGAVGDDLEDMESILDEVTSMFPIQDNRGNVKPLTRHYRSNDERLISWSNYHIYKAVGEELSSFPSTASDPSLVLKHDYIQGVRLADMSHANEIEIDAVILAVQDHVRNSFNLSLGIIGFGRRHSDRLQDAFNILEKTDSEFYRWKAHWSEHREKFFIKNIENVQGDERDSIIITPGYAPNLEGNLLLRFGSLNLSGGERRLNVAASRAKNYMHLITSMRSHEFDLSRTSSRSVALFKSYIEFMERSGHLDDVPEQFSVPESPFEEQILKALTEKGLLVDCQVGESKFKIDFGIRDPKTNKYVLALEADGATYHSSAYARERDWLRQQVLEQKGWSFVRIWSTDWWENPKFQVDRVLDAYNRALANQSGGPQSQLNESFSQFSPSKSEFEGNSDYELLRGILAQFPYTPKDDLLTKWMSVLGLKRKTTQLLDRFENYYGQAKKDIRTVAQ